MPFGYEVDGLSQIFFLAVSPSFSGPSSQGASAAGALIDLSDFLADNFEAGPHLVIVHRKRDAQAFLTVGPVFGGLAKEKVLSRNNDDSALFENMVKLTGGLAGVF